MSDTARMLTILLRGNAKEVFHAEDKITEMVAVLKNNGLTVELIASQDRKTSWKAQIGDAVVKAGKWWWENV